MFLKRAFFVTSFISFLFTSIALVSPCVAETGMVSLTFDDGLISVYDEAFPVLKNYNTKGVIGLVLNRVTSKNNDYMNIKQVLELQKNGWEVASHGLTHKRPTEIPKFYYEEHIVDWVQDDDSVPMYQAKYNYEKIAGLYENEKPLVELGAMDAVRRTPGSFYFDPLISELHVHPYEEAAPRELNIRAVSYQRELQESKEGLERLGCKVNTYLTPYNYWTTEMQQISKYYYKQVANGHEEPNFKENYDPYWLKRYYVRSATPPEEVMRLITKKAIEKNGWVILCFHGIEDDLGWQPWDVENFEELVSWLQEQHVKVVTISEGAAIFDSTLQASSK